MENKNIYKRKKMALLEFKVLSRKPSFFMHYDRGFVINISRKRYTHDNYSQIREVYPTLTWEVSW